jgi:hypothetical protein
LQSKILLSSGLIVPPEEDASAELILSEDKHLIEEEEEEDVNGNVLEKLRLKEKASLLAQEVLKLKEDKIQYTSLVEDFSSQVIIDKRVCLS